jgi:CheY-like chemotaxis protein
MTSNRYRILSVDIDDGFGETTREWFQEHHHHPTTWVRTAEKAIEVLTHERFDVVLAAYSLPGMGGIDLARLLHVKGGPPVIVSSGYWTPDLPHEAYAAGAKALLRKPVSFHWLLRAVELVAGKGLHCVGQVMTGRTAQK